MSRPRVALFALGGTIASTAAPGDAGSGPVTPRLGAEEIVAAVPQLAAVADVEPIAFRQVASPNISFEDLGELARAIEDRIAAGAAGVVVTQGTDTIEETSFALSLLLGGDGATVVVTGAMRDPTLPGADGPANLLAAVRVASASARQGARVLVVMNDQIHLPRYVHKADTSSPAAFCSPGAGPVGWLAEGRAVVSLRSAHELPRLAAPAAGRPLPAVTLVTLCLGDDGRAVDRALDGGDAGIVVAAMGGGHVPAAAVPALERAAARVPVVLTSRTGAGTVLAGTYGFPGSESDLLARGLIHGASLDGLKARVLLTLLLAEGADRERVRATFAAIDG